MKILKIILISVFALVFLLFIAAVILLKTFDINRYKGQIVSQAGTLLRRKVDFDKASLNISLRSGISLKVNNLVIGEDHAFGKEDFLFVKQAYFAVDVLKFLRKKEISVPGILIDSCRVIIIRAKDGAINAATLAGTVNSQKTAAPLAIPALLVDSLTLKNASITYIDRTFEPELNILVSDLNAQVTRFSLFEAFPFSVEASVLSNKKNISVTGKAKVDLKTNQVIITELKGETELSLIALDKIPIVLPMTKGVVLPKSAKGKLVFSLAKLIAGPQGLVDMDALVSLENGSLSFKEIAVPVSDMQATMKITKDNILLDKASVKIGGGEIICSGKIQDYMLKQDFSFSAEAKNLKIQEIADQQASPVKAEGVISGLMKVKGLGSTPEMVKNSLNAEGEFSLEKTKLKDLNVLSVVLGKISPVPGLAQKIESSLPEALKQKLTRAETMFTDTRIPVNFSGGRLLMKEAVLVSEDFLFKASGQANLDATYSMEGAFLIQPALSSSMINAVPQLQYLLNGEKQIYLPLKVKGKAADVQFDVDIEYIAKRLLEGQASTEINKAIDKVFRVKGDSSGQQDVSPDGQNKNLDIKNAVNDILNKIIK